MNEKHQFKVRVLDIVSQIPKGRVMSYGAVAALADNPGAARVVGGIAHFGDPNLPWHRVVNVHGGTAVGYPGGMEAHQKHLESEGVKFNANGRLDMEKYLWQM